jgi:hypothetical protein
MPRRIITLLGIAIAATGAAGEVVAQQWTRIFPGNEYALFDAGSLQRDANGMIHVRVTVGGPAFVAVVNCRDRSSASRYDLERGQPFERPEPDTIAAGLIARVCR